MKILFRAQKALVFLALAVLASVASTEADVVLRKRVLAHFPPGGWCPFERGYEFAFIATTDKADIIFQAQPEEFGGSEVQISDVRVVGEDNFADGFRAWKDLEHWGCSVPLTPYYFSESAPTHPIFEFKNDSGWTLVNATISGGILTLGVESGLQTSARATITGLIPGDTYFLTGWSAFPRPSSEAEPPNEDGEITVKIDTPRPSVFMLHEDRFQLKLRHDSGQFAGGEVVSEQSAVFWFRDPLKTELIVNVIDRCQDKGKYYVEVGGTTTTRVIIEITDLTSGKKWSYENKKGARFQPKVDQQTFRCQ